MVERGVVRAAFDTFEKLEDALRALKDSGVSRYEAFGPTNLAEVEDLMPDRGGSAVRVWATIGAILGLTLFFYMCVKSSLLFDLVVGGKPPVSRVPFVIIAYEGTILLGALCAFFSAIILGRLVFHGPPSYFDSRFTGDSFGVVVWPEEESRSEVIGLLKQSGAMDIDEPE